MSKLFKKIKNKLKKDDKDEPKSRTRSDFDTENITRFQSQRVEHPTSTITSQSRNSMGIARPSRDKGPKFKTDGDSQSSSS